MIDQLKELGFNDKEASVYAALLELGPSSVTEVARQAKINRTTGYDILEKLASKKLVRPAKRRGKAVYVSENPENIKRVLEEEAVRYQQMAEKAGKMMPDLKSLYSEIEKKPIVKFYEGLEGLKSLYEDSLTSSEELRSYTSMEDLKTVLGDYAEDYFAKRKAKGIAIRAIAPASDYAVYLKKVGSEFLREVRIVPADRFNFSPEIYIYENKMTVMSLKEKFGVYIESKEIAEALKKAYELAWEAAGKYDSEISNHQVQHFSPGIASSVPPGGTPRNDEHDVAGLAMTRVTPS